MVGEITFDNLVTLTRLNLEIAQMDVQAASPELERKSSSRRDRILYLALAATVCADAIVALVPPRSEPYQVSLARPERYQVIQTFAAVGRGAKTPMGLAADKAGNLYGSTLTGGSGSWGTIFELSPPSLSGSRWDMQVLSNVNNKEFGGGPSWSMIAPNGDLYGATSDGGVRGGGTLYQFQRGDHGWGEPIPLFNFASSSSPIDSRSELIADSSGALYGTTHGSGGKAGGTVFKLGPGPDGWTMTVLHRFGGGDGDGAYPYGGLAMDGAGALYGTTSGGGKDDLGTVFKLTPTDHGWEQTLLHTFRQMDGSRGEGGLSPMAGLTPGDDGTLYGTTAGGGKFGAGVVFSLTPSDHNGWSQRVLYHFKREAGDGFAPNSRLVFGQSGALYGTTKAGGDMPGYSGYGTVFKLVPAATGWREVVLHFIERLQRDDVAAATGWSEVVLHCFTGGADGAGPTGSLIRDPSGKLFGTTIGVGRSGAPNDGTVFAIETRADGSAKAPSSPK
jgi:uncharacterized repeat protein (TIGR03803 family)